MMRVNAPVVAVFLIGAFGCKSPDKATLLSTELGDLPAVWHPGDIVRVEIKTEPLDDLRSATLSFTDDLLTPVEELLQNESKTTLETVFQVPAYFSVQKSKLAFTVMDGVQETIVFPNEVEQGTVSNEQVLSAHETKSVSYYVFHSPRIEGMKLDTNLPKISNVSLKKLDAETAIVNYEVRDESYVYGFNEVVSAVSLDDGSPSTFTHWRSGSSRLTTCKPIAKVEDETTYQCTSQIKLPKVLPGKPILKIMAVDLVGNQATWSSDKGKKISLGWPTRPLTKDDSSMVKVLSAKVLSQENGMAKVEFQFEGKSPVKNATINISTSNLATIAKDMSLTCKDGTCLYEFAFPTLRTVEELRCSLSVSSENGSSAFYDDLTGIDPKMIPIDEKTPVLKSIRFSRATAAELEAFNKRHMSGQNQR